uniref:Uncharacterized protein n=1 Tax=Arundo donax TaxID=35708 RepID=A0A0A9BLB4_ARUDO
MSRLAAPHVFRSLVYCSSA